MNVVCMVVMVRMIIDVIKCDKINNWLLIFCEGVGGD